MYDIVFISYNEATADKHFNNLHKRFPIAQRVNGIKGIHKAHKVAASKCLTKMFWVVDEDADIIDSFSANVKLSYTFCLSIACSLRSCFLPFFIILSPINY